MPRLDVRSIRRDQILDAAEQLVSRRGWAQTSFAEICREADVSNGVLTYHFKDKDDLFLALFERSAVRWRGHLEEGLCGGCGGAADRLDVLFAEAAEKADREPALYLLLLHYLSEAPDHPEIAARLGALFGEMRARIGPELVSANGGLSCDPAAGAALLQTVLLGFMIGRVTLDLRVPPEEVAAMVSNHLTGGAGHRPPPASLPAGTRDSAAQSSAPSI
jgi:AcrR family transcriptional regulator